MRGYLTAAYKHPIHLEQAVTLVLSFRYRGDHTPFSIVVDDGIYQLIHEKKYSKWFDKIIVLGNDKLYDFIGKVNSALQTPYPDTIFFDNDCILIKGSETLNKELSFADFCLPGGIITEGEYAGYDMKEWLGHNNLKYLPVFNSGVFRYNEKGKEIVMQALSIMNEATKHKLPNPEGGLSDQVAYGIAMARNNIMPLSYYNDLHYTFFNAQTNLQLDIEAGTCSFKKEKTWRFPYIFHYTPLHQAGYYYSLSREILERELNKLRTHFGLDKIQFQKPSLRDNLALLKRGRFLVDGR